jgi:V/A-type H+-transporting ATPase subunit D
MEFIRLRRRVELARRGHKLLKDKLDGLVQFFFHIKNDYLAQHEKIESHLPPIFSKAVFSSALSAPEAFKTAETKIEVETTTRNVMGVKLPSYQIKNEVSLPAPNLLSTVEHREALEGFHRILPELIELAASSRSLKLLASQIIETRRRVNALEYTLIPELERNLRIIRFKLSEMERGSRVVLLKIAR